LNRRTIALLVAASIALAIVALIAWAIRRPTPIEAAMMAAARNGQFQPPVTGQAYTGAIDCRVDRADAFHGADIYLCAIDETGGWREWEWGAMLNGRLHTHRTDPKDIPTITGPWDPPW
jgi:hypothetical protein